MGFVDKPCPYRKCRNVSFVGATYSLERSGSSTLAIGQAKLFRDDAVIFTVLCQCLSYQMGPLIMRRWMWLTIPPNPGDLHVVSARVNMCRMKQGRGMALSIVLFLDQTLKNSPKHPIQYSPHNKELPGPNINSCAAEKPWSRPFDLEQLVEMY